MCTFDWFATLNEKLGETRRIQGWEIDVGLTAIIGADDDMVIAHEPRFAAKIIFERNENKQTLKARKRPQRVRVTNDKGTRK